MKQGLHQLTYFLDRIGKKIYAYTDNEIHPDILIDDEEAAEDMWKEQFAEGVRYFDTLEEVNKYRKKFQA